jgi:hypothetical protein
MAKWQFGQKKPNKSFSQNLNTIFQETLFLSKNLPKLPKNKIYKNFN